MFDRYPVHPTVPPQPYHHVNFPRRVSISLNCGIAELQYRRMACVMIGRRRMALRRDWIGNLRYMQRPNSSGAGLFEQALFDHLPFERGEVVDKQLAA